MRRLLIAAAVTAAAGLSVASAGHAAGGQVVSSTGQAAGGQALSSNAASVSLKTRHGKIGTFLVDGKGRTLYLFQKDTTSKSKCSGACAAAWPPLLSSAKPHTSGSARKALLGTSKRADGTTQVTYKGHPLYYFGGDTKAGDTKGQAVNAFGAKWYAVAPSGKRLGGGY